LTVQSGITDEGMPVNCRLKRYNWHKADFVAIEQYRCNINWTKFICSNPCALSSWAAFLVEEFVPSPRSCSKPSRHKHYPRVIQKLIAKKTFVMEQEQVISF